MGSVKSKSTAPSTFGLICRPMNHRVVNVSKSAVTESWLDSGVVESALLKSREHFKKPRSIKAKRTKQSILLLSLLIALWVYVNQADQRVLLKSLH